MGLLDALFPADCLGCGRPGALVCRCCLAELAGPACPAWPRPTPPDLPPPWSVSAYSGAARDLLISYKERGAGALRRPLAAALATAVSAVIDTAPAERRNALSGPVADRAPVLVPVPSSRAAVRHRGDDVVLGLARGAAAILRRSGLPIGVTAALRHVRVVADSAGLSAYDRAANLAGALAVRATAVRVVEDATIVLVDDLITTGASLAEAARTLRAAGGTVIGAATVAATQRRGADHDAR